MSSIHPTAMQSDEVDLEVPTPVPLWRQFLYLLVILIVIGAAVYVGLHLRKAESSAAGQNRYRIAETSIASAI